jgi:hypothetical protein
MYTFHFCDSKGVSSSFEAFELDHDAAAFTKAGELLDQHQSCDHVDVREGERSVIARHRDQPIIRPIREVGEMARTF